MKVEELHSRRQARELIQEQAAEALGVPSPRYAATLRHWEDRVGGPGGRTGWEDRVGGPGGRTGWEDRVGGPGGRTGWEDRYEADGAGGVDRPAGAAEPVAAELPGGEVDGRAGSGAVGRASRQAHQGFGAGFWRMTLRRPGRRSPFSRPGWPVGLFGPTRPLDTGGRYPPRQARKPEAIARIASGRVGAWA